MSRLKRLSIKRIRVERLFGLYDYVIQTGDDLDDMDRMLILYGDNGSGKTTILRLIFHLLACETQAGHRSFVAKSKFRRVEIEFSDGTQVWAARRDASLLGSYEMGVVQQGRTDTIEWHTGPDNSILVRGPEEDLAQNKFVSNLASLKLWLYLLSDDRQIHISPVEEHMGGPARRRMVPEDESAYFHSRGEDPPSRQSTESPEEISIHLLDISIRKAAAWLLNQLVKGSSRGESDVNIIYTDIINRIVGVPAIGRPEKGATREELCQRIAELEAKNRTFSRFGLAPQFNGKALTSQVQKAMGRQLTLVRRILVPYLESLEAKLNAVKDIQRRIETLVNTINSFLVDKEVDFRIQRGFVIRSRNKEELASRMLSSGERHLLLLFCNTITALDKQCIFIIDEPEISLNVKWQRNLIGSLLACAEGSQVQYIFASHSMEILAQHMDRVVKLEPGQQDADS